MKNICPAIFGFGVGLSLLGLPLMVLAFPFSCYGLFVTGIIVCAVGIGLCTLAVILKCAALLFRK